MSMKMPAPPPPPAPPPANNLSRLTDPQWLEQQATRDALIGAYKQGGADKTMEIIEDMEAMAQGVLADPRSDAHAFYTAATLRSYAKRLRADMRKAVADGRP